MIEPALSPEEWAEYESGGMILPQVENYLSLQDEKYAHAAMALCNASLPDGDKRKITHEHVALIRGVAEYWRPHDGDGPEWDGYHTRQEAVRGLADILESLLPPKP